jgi:hypothetical protein
MSRLSVAWLVSALWALASLIDDIGEHNVAGMVVSGIGVVFGLLLVATYWSEASHV